MGAEVSNPDSLSIVAVGWAVTVALAVGGWVFNAYKSRQLQRKQIAISLLQDNRFAPDFVAAMRDVFYILNHDSSYNWKELATGYFGYGQLEDAQQKTMDSLKLVLNYFELVAVAVKNNAASENLVRWSYESFYCDLATKLKDFFIEARTQTGEIDVWINLTKLAESWAAKPEGAVPTD